MGVYCGVVVPGKVIDMLPLEYFMYKELGMMLRVVAQDR